MSRLQFWLSVGGLAIYVVAMTASGVLQGLSWAAERPFIESVAVSAPWYLLRAIGGSLMALSHLVLAWNLWLMRPQQQLLPAAAAEPAQ
jgi:cytochrome c oxidase cbb3-type subunit 1